MINKLKKCALCGEKWIDAETAKKIETLSKASLAKGSQVEVMAM